MICITQGGILWYIDFIESVTVKLMASHLSKSEITDI